MDKFYAGIGSRETPSDILELMTCVAKHYEKEGYILRTGGAYGADKAFADGCTNKEIFVPWAGYNGLPLKYPVPDEASIIAAKHHPLWFKLPQGAKKMMARNVLQILGPTLDKPSSLVVCWTRDGCTTTKERSWKTGGTGQAISIANTYNIPVYNLARKDHLGIYNKMVKA